MSSSSCHEIESQCKGDNIRIIKIVGPTGMKGSDGPIGPIGPIGPTGPTGTDLVLDSGVWQPIQTNNVGSVVSATSSNRSTFQRIGDVVFGAANGNINSSGGAGVFQISLPVPRTQNFSNALQLSGSFNAEANTVNDPPRSINATQTFAVIGTYAVNANIEWSTVFSYRLFN